jgi:threonine dehydratase
MKPLPTIVDVQEAATRIKPYVHRTPVLTCSSLDHMTGARLFFKCENLQKVGAFKVRGACNAVFSLAPHEARRGVATHSSGNHGAALAYAARQRGITAHIVVPDNAAAVKQAAIAGYGGSIVFCAPTLESREATLAHVVRDTGATVVHPYNDVRVIAGQGTAALELFAAVPDLDIIMAPIGGGGLTSGTALVAATVSPSTQVIVAEPEAADDAYRSLQTGTMQPSMNPQTIADGLRTSLGDITFAIIQRHVQQIVTVSEAAISNAMRLVWERMKIVIEPSAAVPVAALLEGKLSTAGKRVGVILSGGNVDLTRLPWMD